MPELPDIEMYLSAFRERVVGAPVERIRVGSPFVLRSYEPNIGELEGKRVVAMRRIGKRIVFDLEDTLFLVVHLMVAGRFHEKKKGAKVPRRTGLLALDFPDTTFLLTEMSKKKRASVYAVRGEEALAEHDRGGIDVFSCKLDEFIAALQRENHTLKRNMTDPRVFSGIGNGYSDEILHDAQLSPIKWTSRLTRPEMKRLMQSSRRVLKRWTKLLNDERKGAFPERVTAFRPEMVVHGKHKQPCPRCQAPVQRIVRGGSEVNYCAPCQTGGKLLADRALSRLLRGDWPKTLEAWDERMTMLKSGADAPATDTAGESSATSAAVPKAAASATQKRTRSAAVRRPPSRPSRRARGGRAAAPVAKKKGPPLLLFAHGAGAPSSSEWMVRWAAALGEIGKVVTFDYDYMHGGTRRPPDRQDKLLAAHGAALAKAKKAYRGAVVLVGKSMGSRMGCHLSLQTEVDAVVCLGYPLVGSGKRAAVRDEVLKALTTPIMFVQGTRDRMCPLDLLKDVRAQMVAYSQLHVVETGDHSLLATKTWCKANEQTQEQVDEAAIAAIGGFLKHVL